MMHLKLIICAFSITLLFVSVSECRVIYVDPKAINQNGTQLEAIKMADIKNTEVIQTSLTDVIEDIEDSRARPRPPVVRPPNSGVSLFNFNSVIIVFIFASINVFIKF
ncbi:hypothetical protein PVAND_012974 [Polypedilum vanderplanki]|uniref:Uncharacterized protein n=1 Tax=Polypedilum vanderplanki TaxID=319348 RepID=A0A9J6CP08_POLVA|nr:hypothetical protein PVAND_012974 [Polypedilum vanderplanki]